MSVSSRGGRRAVTALLNGPAGICSRCARGRGAPLLSTRRPYSASAGAAAAAADIPSPPPPPAGTTTTTTQPATQTRSLYKIRSGLILSRPPLLTRDPTPFEAAFFLYQKRLDERLSAAFRKQLYFKSDTAAELDWRLKVCERRGTPGRDVGVYNPKNRDAWNDEELVGSPIADPAAVRDALLRDAEVRVSEDGEELPEADRVRPDPPMPRTTQADEAGDVRRLDRKLDRTLYLVVRTGGGKSGGEGKEDDGVWSFPTADVLTDENLHETAARALSSAAGVDMNTWIVGRVPVAHLVTPPLFDEQDASAVRQRGEKVFFLKARIMAGQANIEGNKAGVTDFMWLTKEELRERLGGAYFRGVRNAMPER